jgi:hypothetical protein
MRAVKFEFGTINVKPTTRAIAASNLVRNSAPVEQVEVNSVAMLGAHRWPCRANTFSASFLLFGLRAVGLVRANFAARLVQAARRCATMAAKLGYG